VHGLVPGRSASGQRKHASASKILMVFGLCAVTINYRYQLSASQNFQSGFHSARHEQTSQHSLRQRDLVASPLMYLSSLRLIVSLNYASGWAGEIGGFACGRLGRRSGRFRENSDVPDNQHKRGAQSKQSDLFKPFWRAVQALRDTRPPRRKALAVHTDILVPRRSQLLLGNRLALRFRLLQQRCSWIDCAPARQWH
jgi:hypothetical protein